MNAIKPSLLIVDDEPSIRSVLERAFSKAGFAVVAVSTGEAGLSEIKRNKPDIVILDLNMPGISGQDVCREIRRNPASEGVAVLIITGRIAEGLPASLLDQGADDYVSKPFDLLELVARVKAILRRPRLYVGDQPVIERGGLSIQGASRQVFVRGDLIKLTPKEFDLLNLLVQHAPKVLDRQTLMRRVWGGETEILNDRSLDVHIRRIRQKLGPLERCLVTAKTIGYQWIELPATPA